MIGRNDYIGRTIESNPPKLPDDSEPKRVVTPERIAQYAKAEASAIVEGKVSLPVYDARKAACVSCDARVLSNKLPDELGYCRACGCGVSERSRLTVKLWMPSATCPRVLWKPAAGRRWERLKAMSETVVSLLDMRRWLG